MKNKITLIRIAKKGSKTIPHRGLTESINILKTLKLTENTSIWKAVALH